MGYLVVPANAPVTYSAMIGSRSSSNWFLVDMVT
jgi:hypothetical protein